MKKKLLIGVAAIMLVAILAFTGCAATGTGAPASSSGVNVNLNNQQEGIWVNGEGKVTAIPDIATISVGVDSQAATVTEAQSKATTAMNNIMKVLKDNGVAEKDIKTQYFNIQQMTRWDQDRQQSVVIGYQVTNTVTAKIRQLDKAGTIIDAAAVAGGDLTRVNGISFSIDDPTALQNQARDKAMAAAKAKAEQLAKAAGVTLGKPSYVTESSYIPGPIYRDTYMKAEAAMAPAATPTPISAGEMEITVNVQVTYNIL
ncbi:SIMPL domain-containing protein [Chloroflexota bacterium]